MAKPKTEPTSSEYRNDVDLFYETCQILGKNRLAWRQFFQDLLTPSELRMIKRRWYIARLLAEGRSIRQVAALAKVGTDTVNRVSKVFHSGSGVLRRVVSSSGETRPRLPRNQKSRVTHHWIFGDVKEQ